jgi:hypothetical protein
LGGVDPAAVTTKRTVRFPDAATMVMVVELVGEMAAWSQAWCRRWRRSGTTTTVKAEEERDGSVPRRSGEGRADDGDNVDQATVAAASKRAQKILAA